MLSNQIIVFLTAFSAVALAVPNKAPPPVKTITVTKPVAPTATVVSNKNSCGNDASVYCCSTDGTAPGLYGTCSLLLGESQRLQDLGLANKQY